MKLHADSHPGKTAIVFEGETITYGDLAQRVERSAGFFAQQLGNGEQQLAALLITNSIDFVAVYLGILQAGHIALPIDPVFKRLEVDAILKRFSPRLLVMQTRYEDKVSGGLGIETVGVRTVLDHEQPADKPLRLAPEEQIASLTFTSGTSGQPKGVPNTHANHAWNIATCSQVWDWTPEDNLLITLPLSHMHGLVIGLSGAIYHGNTLYLHQQSFDAEAVLEQLSSGEITIFTHGPIAYMKMLEAAGDYDISRVRRFISGSAPLPPVLWRRFKHRFGVEILETYGTSETGRIAGNLPGRARLGTPGKIMPGVDVRLAKNQEVMVKSGGLFPGYWQNQAATAEARTADGYWRTGDLGEIKDGYLYLKGRLQERIRKAGYTISPRDVEWALLDNPRIKEAYVIGRQRPGQPDDELLYFLSGKVTEQAVIEYCRQNLPFSWRPDKIVILDALPRTKTGKPHLKQLREMAGA